MVQHQVDLDATFGALADPTRRRVLERLGGGSATITELAQPFAMSLTGMKKHVRILEDAELVRTEKVGRTRRCSLGARRLEDLEQWIEAYRRTLDGRLDRLAQLIEEDEREPADAGRLQ
jgi:DNA-binding transcriptional ArsR family regulator